MSRGDITIQYDNHVCNIQRKRSVGALGECFDSSEEIATQQVWAESENFDLMQDVRSVFTRRNIVEANDDSVTKLPKDYEQNVISKQNEMKFELEMSSFSHASDKMCDRLQNQVFDFNKSNKENDNKCNRIRAISNKHKERKFYLRAQKENNKKRNKKQEETKNSHSLQEIINTIQWVLCDCYKYKLLHENNYINMLSKKLTQGKEESEFESVHVASH